MSEPEQPTEIFTLAPDGWLTIVMPLHVHQGERLALGRLRQAELLVTRYFDRFRRVEAEKRRLANPSANGVNP